MTGDSRWMGGRKCALSLSMWHQGVWYCIFYNNLTNINQTRASHCCNCTIGGEMPPFWFLLVFSSNLAQNGTEVWKRITIKVLQQKNVNNWFVYKYWINICSLLLSAWFYWVIYSISEGWKSHTTTRKSLKVFSDMVIYMTYRVDVHKYECTWSWTRKINYNLSSGWDWKQPLGHELNSNCKSEVDCCKDFQSINTEAC